MTVLHVIPAVARRYGGPSEVVFGMSRALRDRGLDVTIATTDADGAGRLPLPIGQVSPYREVPTIAFRRRLGDGFKFSPGLSQWLRASVRQFDVVHVHAVFSHSSMAAASACQRSDVPYVVRPLGSLDPWSLAQKAPLKRLLLNTGVRRMLERAAAVHFTAGEEQRLAEQSLGQLAGVVVPLGLDESAFEPEAMLTPDRERLVVAMARLDRKKNIDGLIAAFAGALDRLARLPGEMGASWRLVIAGDGDPAYREYLQTAIQASGAAASIALAGWIAGDDKRGLLGRAALFALPSHQENFGLSALEAMAAGVPVVVSEGVNIAQIIRDAGAGWVSSLSHEALTSTLASAMGDAAERQRRGMAARNLARAYRWSSVAATLEALYRRVAARRPGGL